MKPSRCFLFLFLVLALFLSAAAEAGGPPCRPDTVLYSVEPAAGAAQQQALQAALNRHGLKPVRRLGRGRAVQARAGHPRGDAAAMCAELVATGAVRFAEPDRLVAPVAVPDDAYYSLSWHHTVMNSPAAWDVTTGSAAVIVAVCDTGVDTDHPDLAANLLPGYNAVDGSSRVEDKNGHGTMTAGCVGAVGNNGRGACGVNWTVSILPVKVSNRRDGSAYLSDMAEAICWAVDHGARVTNLSYSGGDSPTIDAAAAYVRGQGGLHFQAAGNENADVSNWPDYASFLLVGATDQNDDRADFSNYGTAVDLVAPGVDIVTTGNRNQYYYASGTSFASPLAAGLAGLIFSLDPGYTPDDVEGFLTGSCADLGAPGEDQVFGHGRIDAAAALSLAGGTPPPPPPPPGNEPPLAVASAAPASGDAPLAVTLDGSASSDADGAIVGYSWDLGDGNSADGATVTHTYADPGDYTATLTVTDDEGASDSATVSIRAADPNELAAPTGLTADVSGSTVTLSWTDNSANEDGFAIERGLKVRGKFTFEPAAEVGADVTAYSEDLSRGSYIYRVRAFNAAQVSDWSETAPATIKTAAKAAAATDC